MCPHTSRHVAGCQAAVPAPASQERGGTVSKGDTVLGVSLVEFGWNRNGVPDIHIQLHRTYIFTHTRVYFVKKGTWGHESSVRLEVAMDSTFHL